MKKLNLGSGQFKKAGYVNVDWDEKAAPDIQWDLSKSPYPFADNEFQEIISEHCLEHLEDVFGVMKELQRILAFNGKLIIKVPHFSRGFSHPEHKSGFDVTFPLYFNPAFKGGYTGTMLTSVKIQLYWLGQREFKKEFFGVAYYPLRCLDIIYSFLANLSPGLCSRFWCYWVGGFEEIEYIFIKKDRLEK